MVESDVKRFEAISEALLALHVGAISLAAMKAIELYL